MNDLDLDLDLNQLMSFREIAEEKSLSRAASKLKIGQPAMSSQLKKFEDQIGYQLFERKNRKLHLTEMGKLVLQCANEVYQSSRYLQEIVKKGTLTSIVNLTLGVLDSVPKHLVLKLIMDARAIGNCRVKIIEGSAEDLLVKLQAHAIDLVISNYYAPVSIHGGLYSRHLAKSSVAVYGAPKYKKLCAHFPLSLSGQSFILPTFHSKLRHDVEYFFRTHSLDFEVSTETQDTSIQKLLCQEGLGLIVLPEFSVDQAVQEKKLIRLGLMKNVYEEFWLISTKRTIENPFVSQLAKFFDFSGSEL